MRISSSIFKQPDARSKTRVITPGLSAPGLATWCSRAFSSKSPRQIVASVRPERACGTHGRCGCPQPDVHLRTPEDYRTGAQSSSRLRSARAGLTACNSQRHLVAGGLTECALRPHCWILGPSVLGCRTSPLSGYARCALAPGEGISTAATVPSHPAPPPDVRESALSPARDAIMIFSYEERSP